MRHHLLASPMRGLFGGRIRLFDHQLSVAYHACQRSRVRVLLSDEVGLGKTIEALLILHRMLLTGRVENALILVPPALVHQWLAEAYLRFNLVLRVMGSDTYEEGRLTSERRPPRACSTPSSLCVHSASRSAGLQRPRGYRPDRRGAPPAPDSDDFAPAHSWPKGPITSCS